MAALFIWIFFNYNFVMNKIILIGGAEGTGKSTLAEQLSKHFGIPWFSTDQIRTILHTRMTEDEKEDKEKISEAVWKGVKALVDRPFPWEKGGVIEGTGILPELVARDLKENSNVKVVFLVQEDENKIAYIISERSKLPWIKTKSEEQKKEKIEMLTDFNRKLIEELKRFGFPAIVAHSEKTFSDVLATIEI